ncbi:hypothetical protein MP228_002828 [Amoeboaphelidium protococcarum]|nr:hypothetical protein MP228_002828 [Amoeboaphelidium protococcarum]
MIMLDASRVMHVQACMTQYTGSQNKMFVTLCYQRWMKFIFKSDSTLIQNDSAWFWEFGAREDVKISLVSNLKFICKGCGVFYCTQSKPQFVDTALGICGLCKIAADLWKNFHNHKAKGRHQPRQVQWRDGYKSQLARMSSPKVSTLKSCANKLKLNALSQVGDGGDETIKAHTSVGHLGPSLEEYEPLELVMKAEPGSRVFGLIF